MDKNAGMELSDAGLTFIAQHEGFSAQVYNDSGGQATIGYGHVLRSGEAYPEGIAEVDAMQLLASDVATAAGAVRSNVEVQLIQNQFDALVSFAFNAGPEAFARSTMLIYLNAAQFDKAAEELPRWNKVAFSGVLREEPGLTRRRLAEQTLFTKGAYS